MHYIKKWLSIWLQSWYYSQPKWCVCFWIWWIDRNKYKLLTNQINELWLGYMWICVSVSKNELHQLTLLPSIHKYFFIGTFLMFNQAAFFFSFVVSNYSLIDSRIFNIYHFLLWAFEPAFQIIPQLCFAFSFIVKSYFNFLRD